MSKIKANLSGMSSSQVDSKTARRVHSVMSKLVLRSAFFATLLLQQKIEYTTEIDTMATNGKSIFINPTFVDRLTVPEMTGVFIHELYHTIFLHMTRLGVRDPMLFNMAADYAINLIVKDDGFTLPEPHLYDERFKGMTADKIYNILEKENPKPPEWIQDIVYTDHLSESEKSALEQNTKINVSKAMNAAKQAGGHIPDALSDVIKKALAAKVDWKVLLREFVQTSLGDEEATWKRPNRNYIHKHLYLPSYESQTMPSIAIMIDTSGSIYAQDKLFKQFTGEINKIIQDHSPEQVDVFYVDTEIRKHDTYTESELPEYKLVGGGGTDFRSAWPKMEEVEPSCIVAFTDCWADFPKHSNVPTLWINYENTDPHVPFGKIVMAE